MKILELKRPIDEIRFRVWEVMAGCFRFYT